MKRATSASVAAATAAATQVHHQSRIQELFSPGSMPTAAMTTTTTTSTSATTIVGSCADELDKQITTISSRLEPKGSPKISPGTGDDNKAKSTVMSRLLAVDSDNYMLRKAAATATTTATNGATAPSSTTSSSSSSTSSSSSLNGSASMQLQRQMQGLAIGSATAPSILATYGNSGDHVVSQLYDVARATSRSMATYVSPRWYTASNNNQATRQHRDGTAAAAVAVAAVAAAAQLEEQSLQQLQLQSRTATSTRDDATTPAVSTAADGVESELGFTRLVCARPVSFHRYMCWCSAQQQQQQLQLQQSAVAEGVDVNSIGRAKGGRGLATHEGLATRRMVRDDNSNSLCCCMCGSLCPAECHACFHIVCSDYSSQHLCKWTHKGHALPGQVHDKDKVSKSVLPRYITDSVPLQLIILDLRLRLSISCITFLSEMIFLPNSKTSLGIYFRMFLRIHSGTPRTRDT